MGSIRIPGDDGPGLGGRYRQPGDPPLLTAVLADLAPRQFSAQIEVLDSEEQPDGTTLIKEARLLSVGVPRDR